MTKKRNLSYASYFGPRFWPLWLVLGLCRIVASLPLSLQLVLGRLLGSLAYHTLKRRRQVTQMNIRACFPDLSDAEQKALVKASFRSNGMGLLESLRSWFVDPKTLATKTRFHGLENLQDALQKGKGVILLGGHFSTLDLVGSLTTMEFKADVLQRDHSNPLFNTFMTRSRQRLYEHVISKQDIRQMLKSLRQNHVVWYATDQDYGRNSTVFVPFFGIPCSTLASTAKIAQSSGAAVVPFCHFRNEEEGGYDIYLQPALEAFPCGDVAADATRLNQLLEENIRLAPEQYLWMHRRFKTCPEKGEINIYGQVSG